MGTIVHEKFNQIEICPGGYLMSVLRWWWGGGGGGGGGVSHAPLYCRHVIISTIDVVKQQFYSSRKDDTISIDS